MKLGYNDGGGGNNDNEEEIENDGDCLNLDESGDTSEEEEVKQQVKQPEAPLKSILRKNDTII